MLHKNVIWLVFETEMRVLCGYPDAKILFSRKAKYHQLQCCQFSKTEILKISDYVYTSIIRNNNFGQFYGIGKMAIEKFYLFSAEILLFSKINNLPIVIRVSDNPIVG